jgi:hypothetical protein
MMDDSSSLQNGATCAPSSRHRRVSADINQSPLEARRSRRISGCGDKQGGGGGGKMLSDDELSSRRITTSRALRLSEQDFMKDEELLTLIRTNTRHVTRSMKRTVRNPVTYFGLLVGSEMYPEIENYKKVGHAELIADFTNKLESDICAAEKKCIDFFSAVILSSLYVRRQSKTMQFQFVLFDGMNAFIHLSSNKYDCVLRRLCF